MKRILPVLLLFVSICSQAQWSQLGGPPGANIADLERTSGGKLYAVASQTLYESTNSGASWQKTTITTPATNFYMDDLTINPTTGKMYAINYSQLYSSMDGTNWTRVSSGFNGMYRITRFGPDGFLAISGQNGVYVSKDDGVTWTQILTDIIYNNYKLITNAAGDLFAPTSSGIKRYLYPGAAGVFNSTNWTTVYSIPLGSSVNNLTLGIDGSNNLYSQIELSNASPNYDFIGSTAASNGTSWSSLIMTGMTDSYYFGFWASFGSSIYFFNNSAGKIYSTSNAFATSSFGLTGAITTNGSSYIVVTSTASLKVGDRITGTGIPASTSVTQIVDATSFYINKNATASNTGLTLTGTTLTASWASSLSPSSQYGSYLSSAVFASASTYFLGSAGDGIFSTSNSGASFARGTGLNIGYGTQVEVANVTGRIIYTTNNNSKGYWTSTDNGVNWSFVPLVDYVRKIEKVVDGTLLMYGDRLYRSIDNGATFSTASITNNTNFGDIAPHPSISGKLYGGTGSNIYVTTNSGLDWSALTISGMPTQYWASILAVSSSDVIYAYVYDYGDGKYKFYKIVSGVASLISNVPWLSAQYFNANNIFIQGGKLYVASNDAVYSTADDGATWSTSSFSGIAVFPITQGAYSGIAFSRTGTLYVTQDDGKSFNSTQLPTSNAYVTDMALDLSGKFIASAYNSPALKFTGNLTSDPSTLPTYIDFGWQPTNGPYGGYARELAVDNSNNVYLLSNPAYKANLAVTSWSRLGFPAGYNYFNSLALKKSANTIYMVEYDRIFSSADGGTSWTTFNQEAIIDRQKMVVCPNGVNIMIANNSIFATAANGNTFGTAKYAFTASERFYYYYSHAIVSTSNNVVLIEILDPTTGKEKLKRSTNSGVNWTDVTLPNDQSNTISVDNSGNVYVVNYSGIYKSADNGTTWASIKGDITTGWSYDAKVNISAANELFFCVQDGVGYRIKKSVNGGTNWTNLGLINKRVLEIAWQGTKMIAASANGIQTSTDGGLTFVDASTGFANLPTSDLYLASQNRLLVGVSDGTFAATKSEDKGNAWTEMPYSFRQFFDHPDGSLIGIVANGDKAYRSIDAGLTWVLYASFSQQANQYFTANGTDHYIRTRTDIYYSTNLTAWTKLNISGIPDSNNRELREIAADANGIGYLIMYNYQTQKEEAYQILFGSGVALTQITNPRSVKYYNNKIYLYGAEGTLAITADGSTWIKKSVPGGDKFIITTKEYYFITQYDGTLWLSRNLGDAWQNVGLSGASAFQDVVVNEYDGYAYAILTNSVVRKSANVVIPDDVTAPVVSTLSPSNNSTNTAINTKLTITFDEAVVPQVGKTLRILDLTNATLPIETLNVTAGTQSGKSFTFTLTNPLGYLKTYFVVIDAAAFKDIFGNSYSGILNNASWRFTTQEAPDTQKPTIVFNTTNLNLEKGVAKTIEITVNDNKTVPTNKTKISYRKITDPTSALFTSVDMTAGAGSGSGSAFTNNFTKDASEGWYDEMGLEFFFETADAAGNTERSPSTANTYYYSYIDYKSDNTYPLLNSVLSFGGNQNNYRIITIPYKLSSTSASTILNEIGGGAIDKTQWRLFTLGASNSYKEETTFVRGKGYWINIRSNPGNIKIEGSSSPEFNKSSFDQITLSPGWNMIGNPYPVDISWEETRAGNSAVGKLKVFNGSAYTDGDILKSLEGGFVNNTSASSVTLKVRFKGITTGGRTTKNEIGSDLAATKWLVPISAENSEITNALGGVGMHAEAKSGWDVFDDMNPPRFLEAAELAFVKTDEDVKKLAKDVVPTKEEYVWYLNVEAAEGITVLNWDNNSIVTNGKELMLYDGVRQKIVDMKTEGSYSFQAKEGNTFRIYFGTNLRSKIKPTSISLSKPYPNPMKNEAAISFTLPDNQSAYQTRLEVYNSMGQRVTTLAEGNFESGFYSTSWSSESQAAGMYFFRLSVTEGGIQKILTEKVIIDR